MTGLKKIKIITTKADKYQQKFANIMIINRKYDKFIDILPLFIWFSYPELGKIHTITGISTNEIFTRVNSNTHFYGITLLFQSFLHFLCGKIAD